MHMHPLYIYAYIAKSAEELIFRTFSYRASPSMDFVA